MENKPFVYENKALLLSSPSANKTKLAISMRFVNAIRRFYINFLTGFITHVEYTKSRPCSK